VNGVPTPTTILPAGTTYSWTLPVTSGGVSGVTSGTNQTPFSQTLINTTTDVHTATYVVTPTSGSCDGSVFPVQITVNPIPQLSSVLTPPDMCSGSFVYTPSSATLGSQWTWTRAAVPGIAQASSQSAGFPAPGAGLVNEMLTNTTTSPVDATYSFTTYANGCSRVQSVVVRVNPTPVANPVTGPVTVCAGTGNTYFYSVTQKVGSTYSWDVPIEFEVAAAGGGALPGNGQGPFSADYFVLLRFNTATVQSIRVYERSADGCVGVVNLLPITVSSGPATVPITGPVTVCGNSAGVVYSVPSNPTSSFIWTASGGAAIIGPSAGPNLNQIAVDFTNLPNATISVTETNISGCPAVYPSLDITINQTLPVVNSVTPIVVCSGDPISTIVFTSNADPGVTFDWTNDNPSINLGSDGIGNIVGFNSAVNTGGTAMLANISVTGTKSGCSGATMNFTITINPQPVMVTPLPSAICSRDVTDIAFGTNGVSVIAGQYRLNNIEYSSNGGSFSVIPPPGFVPSLTNKLVGSAGGSTHIGDDAFENTSLFPVTVRYTVVPISPGTAFTPAGCEGDPVQVEITVNPEPLLDPALSPTDICSDETIEGGTPLPFELTSAPGSIAATSFILRGVSAGGLTAGPSNETLGSGKDKDALDDDRWVNVTNSTRTAVYTIAAVSGSCVGADQTVTVQVNPAPALSAGLDRIVCSDGTTGVLLIDNSPTSAPAGSFDILSVVVETAGADPSIVPGGTTLGVTANAGNAAIGMSTSINYIQNDRYTNDTDDRAVVIYTVVPVAPVGMNSCRGQEAQVRVTIEPQIKSVSVNSTVSICSGTSVSITLQSPTYSNGNPTNPLVTFNYTAVPVAGLFGATVGNAVAYVTVVDDNLVNNSTGDINVNYKVTAVAATAANGLGCSSIPEDVFVLVRPLPKANNISNKTICSGDKVSITLSSPTYPATPSNIEFEVTTTFSNAGISGFPSGPRIFVNPAIMGDVLVNASATSGKVTYQIIPRSIAAVGGCINPTAVLVDVTVSPRPVITPISDFALCSGDTFDPKPIITDTENAPGGEGSTLVSWSVNPALSPVTGESNGSGNTFAQTLFNNTNDKHVVIYSITARNISSLPSCLTEDPVTLRVTVYPNPVMASLPASFDVCNNSGLSPGPYVLQSNVAPSLNTRFDWTVDDSGNPDLPDLPPVSGATAINQTYQNNGDFMGSYQYTISPYLIIPASDNPVIEIPNGTDDRCSGVVDGITVVNVAPTVGGRIYGFDINGNETDEMFVCAGSSTVVFMEPTGLALMQITYSEAGETRTLNNLGGLKQLQVKPTATTVFELLSVRDAFGCEATINERVTVNVGAVDNTFAIVGADIACAPFDATFQHNQAAGVNYTWKWLDGPDSTTYLAASSVSNKIIKHRFLNPSPSAQARYRVQLDAFLDTTKYMGGCRKPPFVRDVRVYPTITAAVFPDEEVICSDEQVSFVNSSQGATIHKWFYREQGSSTEIDVRATRVPANYRLPNQTSSNPLIIEVVYQATNASGCNAPMVVTPITVFRGVEAGFSHTPPTVFVAGASSVDFTNTSDPIAGTDFRYEWDFGLNSTPATPQGIGPFHVVYSTPGPKEIVLTATNILAEQNGLKCSDEHHQNMQIIIPPLVADFVVIPAESCFPTDITVTENNSTGDKFAWRVMDDGGTAASSNATLPVFKIPSPGIYTVELVTTNSFTGDEQRLTKEVVIHDIPTAAFSVRPIVVYVPDGPVNIVNTSRDASGYQWDFGDGTLSDDEEPTHTYTAEGIYNITLVAMSDHGNDVICYDTVAHMITAKQGGVSRIPNAFTPSPYGSTSSHGTPGLPGSNTYNDVFLPQVKGADEFNMQVFDRWGNLIFESNSATVGWDGYDETGKLMPAGVYVYKLTLRLSDGQRTTQIGDITMIR
jgi:gliding motility-associated-like protein